MEYVELHARSAFNFLRGASLPGELVEAAARAGMPALGVLDRDGVYGAPAVQGKAREQGVRPVVGAELTMEDGSVLPVLVRTGEGYRNLCRALTAAQLRSAKGQARLGWRELHEHRSGLTALTGDEEGPLLAGWRRSGAAGMEEALARIRAVFPKGEIHIEIQRHRNREELLRNRALVELAESSGLPLLATNGPLCATAEGLPVCDVFTCLRHRTTLDRAGRLLQGNRERWLKPEQAMRELFQDIPQALLNTRHLAERLEFTLEDLDYRFPEYPVPPGECADSFLRKMTWFGAQQRYAGLSQEVRRQLEHELGLITRLGLSGYFLIVWDIVNYCREQDIMVQGRGSAANSAVCYSLGITAVEPVGNRLLFERFLSEGRQSWPDIDLDLPSGERRERVIQEVYRRYGPHGAAMTANVITYRGRGAMREIGKVLELPDDLLGRFSALAARGDYPDTLAAAEQFRKAGMDTGNPRHRAALGLYQRMLGLPRHLGQHSGGMIVCQDALSGIVPLENASMPGRVVAQWDKEACEDLGIVKIDLLGLGMMAVLQEALAHTRERGHPVDLARIPLDDAATYERICRAETIGVFQIESRAQMATLPRMKPRCFYDLVVEVAIIRPGPIAGGLAHPYLNRRNGLEPVEYMDERLKPILERTLGVPLFQEQVLRIAMVMADFSASEAEELRRAVGFHRNHERMDRVKARLRGKMLERGVPEETADRIVSAVSSFALYGFPESHAFSFALLAYGSAYLKTHYTAEFYAGILNNQPMGFYSPATILQEARRGGMRFFPPCVVASEAACSIASDRAIRLGLRQIRGVGEEGMGRLIEARQEMPFRSLHDLRCRVKLDRDELRLLARAGALNALCGSRRRALWAVETPDPAGDLFAAAADKIGSAGDDPALPEMEPAERVQADFETTHLTVGAHPMNLVRPGLPPRIWRAVDLEQATNGERIEVAGAVICRQRPGTARGVVFVSLEDETGIANAVVHADLFERLRLTIVREPYLVVRGTIQKAHGTIHVIAEDLCRLEAVELPGAASHDFH